MATPAATPLYEGMFLFNPSAIDSSPARAMEIMNEVLDRAEAEVEAIHKWDERRMAYPIEGQKRGLYVLAYFRVRGARIANIERDVNLSDELMRCLIVRADHIGDAELDLARQKQADSRDAGAAESSDESSPSPRTDAAADKGGPSETAPDADAGRAPAEKSGEPSGTSESAAPAAEEAEKS